METMYTGNIGRLTDVFVFKKFALLPEEMTNGDMVFGVWYEITPLRELHRLPIVKLSKETYLADRIKGYIR